MIGKNFIYKWLNMSDENASSNNFVLQEVNKNVWYRSIVKDKQNYHWSDASPTLASGRLFTFEFIIFWDRTQRANWQKLLESVIVPEYNPWKTSWLYTLQWTNDEWINVKIQAQVYWGIRYNTSRVWSYDISWSFELFAPDPVYQWLITKTNFWTYWRNGGCKLWTTLWVKLDEMLAEITFENTWNWTAPVRIEVVWNIENPKIKNITADTFYWLSRTCNDLLIDWTWTWLIVTDEWVNVKADRMSGSEILRVLPWENTFLLSWTNFSYDSDVEWNIYFNDSYL